MKRWGFTLVELIVVIAIIAVLAAVVAPAAFRTVEKSKIAKAVSDFKAIKAGVADLFADTGNKPHGYNSQVRIVDSDLMRNASGYANWDGPYMDRFPGNHPWRGTYYFTTNGNMGRGPGYEFAIEFENRCFPNGPNGGCPIPVPSSDRIDAMLDDGNQSTGEVQIVPWTDLHWALEWDVCPVASCW